MNRKAEDNPEAAGAGLATKADLAQLELRIADRIQDSERIVTDRIQNGERIVTDRVDAKHRFMVGLVVGLYGLIVSVAAAVVLAALRFIPPV